MSAFIGSQYVQIPVIAKYVKILFFADYTMNMFHVYRERVVRVVRSKFYGMEIKFP